MAKTRSWRLALLIAVTLLLVVVSGAWFIGRSLLRRGPMHRAPETRLAAARGTVLKFPGTYVFPSGETLRVAVVNGIVQFRMLDKEGQLLLVNDRRASTYHRWSLYFDDRGWLWFQSSDIGDSVWRMTGGGMYEETTLGYKLPVEVAEALPEHMKLRIRP